MNALKTVLKKCKNINKIYITHEYRHKFNDEEVMQLIKYCHNLSSITFHFNNLKIETIREFGLKFGQNLRVINFRTRDKNDFFKYKTLLRLTPNITRINRYGTGFQLIIDNNKVLTINSTHFEQTIK